MISFLLVTLFRVAHFGGVAFAADVPGGQGNTNQPPVVYELPNPLGTTSFTALLGRILQGVTLLAIPVVAIIVVVAGIQLITSGGAPEKRTKAKDMILWAAIGFGVLLLADSIVSIVTSFLTTP